MLNVVVVVGGGDDEVRCAIAFMELVNVTRLDHSLIHHLNIHESIYSLTNKDTPEHLLSSDESFPLEPVNISSLSALEVAQAPHRVCEKDLA